jgi:hypothetical protein
MVCAIVLRVKIAVIGLTASFSFNLAQISPLRFPEFCINLICPWDIERRTDSRILQRKETPKARIK